MKEINIFVEFIKSNKSESLGKNNIRLKYTLPENCCVLDLINTINQFKSPKNQIKQLINHKGVFNPSEQLKQGYIYYYFC